MLVSAIVVFMEAPPTPLPDEVPFEHRALQSFLKRLNEWLPADDRDPRNYKNSLGAFLSEGGVQWEEVPLEVAGAVSLQSKIYVNDILTPFDVAKVREVFGDKRTVLYFHSLTLALQDFVPQRSSKGSREEFKGVLQRWFTGTKLLRLGVAQDAYELGLQDPHAPWEWILALVDFDGLRGFKTI